VGEEKLMSHRSKEPVHRQAMRAIWGRAVGSENCAVAASARCARHLGKRIALICVADDASVGVLVNERLAEPVMKLEAVRAHDKRLTVCHCFSG
jgi:hypothetical protein